MISRIGSRFLESCLISCFWRWMVFQWRRLDLFPGWSTDSVGSWWPRSRFSFFYYFGLCFSRCDVRIHFVSSECLGVNNLLSARKEQDDAQGMSFVFDQQSSRSSTIQKSNEANWSQRIMSETTSQQTHSENHEGSCLALCFSFLVLNYSIPTCTQPYSSSYSILTGKSSTFLHQL